MEALKKIGVCDADLLIFGKVLLSENKSDSFSNFLNIRIHGQNVYHMYELSLPFRMMLRVVYGLTNFPFIDENHQRAIFYPFEYINFSDNKPYANLQTLEMFWQLMRNFWGNKELSGALQCKLLNELKDKSVPGTLVENLEEFGFKIHMTRSKPHLLQHVCNLQHNKHDVSTYATELKKRDNERERSTRLNNEDSALRGYNFGYNSEYVKDLALWYACDDGFQDARDKTYRWNHNILAHELELENMTLVDFFNEGAKAGYNSWYTFFYEKAYWDHTLQFAAIQS